MTDVLAVVAKAVFEKQAPKHAALGEVWDTAAYLSHHAKLEPLSSGGALFLATVRPPDERLWLVAVLEAPTHGKDGWTSAPNVVPITDITALLAKLRFESGKGNTAEPGKLGMSLQTPRGLTEADVARIRAALGPSPAEKTTNAAATTAAKPKGAKSKTKAAVPVAAPADASVSAVSDGVAFDPVAARATHADRVNQDLAKLDAKTRAAIDELVKAAGKSPKKALVAMKQLVASFGAKKPVTGRLAYDALALACLDKHRSFAADAFGEARGLGRKDEQTTPIADDLARMRIFSRVGAIWGSSLVALLEDPRTKAATTNERRALHDLVVELAGTPFDPYADLVEALVAYDAALAGEALKRWVEGDAPGRYDKLDSAVWKAFGDVFGAQARVDAGVRRFAATRVPYPHTGGGRAWLEILRAQKITAIVAEQEPTILLDHLGAFLEIAGHFRTLGADVNVQRTVLGIAEETFAFVAPRLRSLGLAIDLSRPNRGTWKPLYVDLPRALILEMLLAAGVPLHLPPDPDADPTALLPLLSPGLVDPVAMGEYGALRLVSAQPLLLGALARQHLPGHGEPSDKHEHIGGLTKSEGLVKVLPHLAAFVEKVRKGSLAAFVAYRGYLEAFVQGGIANRSPALADALGSLDAAALLQRQLSRGLMAEWGWPAFDKLCDELGTEGTRNAINRSDAYRTEPQLFVGSGRRLVSLGPFGVGVDQVVGSTTPLGRDRLATGNDILTWDANDNARWLVAGGPPIAAIHGADLLDGFVSIAGGERKGQRLVPGTPYAAWQSDGKTADKLFYDGTVCVLLPEKTHARADGTLVDALPEDRQHVHAMDTITGALGGVVMPAFFRTAFAKAPANAELAAEGSRLFPVPAASSERALGAADGVAGLAVFRVPGTVSQTYAAVRPDGRVWTGRTPPEFLLGFPGRIGEDALYANGLDANGLPHFSDDSDLQEQLWGGSPLQLPVDYWHLFEPRDPAGSAALAACSLETARTLLAAGRAARVEADPNDDFEKLDYGDLLATVKGPKRSIADAKGFGSLFAAVQKAFPAVSHPRLLTGIAEIVLLAAREETAIADLHGKLAALIGASAAAKASASPGTKVDGQDERKKAAPAVPTKPGLTNKQLEALAEVFGQDIQPWWVEKKGEALGLQIDEVDAFLFDEGAEPMAAVAPARTAFAWHHLVARMGEVLFALLATGTPDEKRQQLVTALDRWAETRMAAHAGQLRIVSLAFDALPHATMDDDHPDWLMAWENRYFLRLSGIRNGKSTFLAIERTKDGVFRAPPGSSVAWDARDARASKGTVLAALSLLRDRGPLPWDPAIADALMAGTGLGQPSATLLWGGSSKPFAPGKQGKAALGLRAADLEIAEMELARYDNRFLYQEGMPTDPAALYTPLAKGPTGESVVDTFVALWNGRDRKKAPLPIALVKRLRDDLASGKTPLDQHARALLSPETNPRFTEDRAWTMPAYGEFSGGYVGLPKGWPVPVPNADDDVADEHGDEIACFALWVLEEYAPYLAWAHLELPYGDAARTSVGRLATLFRKRLENPALLGVAGWIMLSSNDLEKNLSPYRDRFEGPAYAGVSNVDHAPGFDNGDLVVTWPDPPESDGFYLAFRPARVADQASFERLANRLKLPPEARAEIVGRPLEAKGKDTTTAERFQTYLTFRSPGFQRLLDDLVAPADAAKRPPGSYAADPRVSAPATVLAARKTLSLEEDAATLYLQIATLPDPSRERVCRYNGWTAAQHEAAASTLLKRKLVIEAKQGRTSRTLYLAGQVLTLGVSARPIEASKAPLYGLLADATKKQKTIFPVVLPLSPLSELFAEGFRLAMG